MISNSCLDPESAILVRDYVNELLQYVACVFDYRSVAMPTPI